MTATFLFKNLYIQSTSSLYCCKTMIKNLFCISPVLVTPLPSHPPQHRQHNPDTFSWQTRRVFPLSVVWGQQAAAYWLSLPWKLCLKNLGALKEDLKNSIHPVHTKNSYLCFKNTGPLLLIVELLKPVGQFFHTKYVAVYFLPLSSTVSETCAVLARLLAL